MQFFSLIATRQVFFRSEERVCELSILLVESSSIEFPLIRTRIERAAVDGNHTRAIRVRLFV